MQCPKCGHLNESDKKFCTQCGESLQRKTCPNGHPIPPALSECPYCPKPSSKTVVENPDNLPGAGQAQAVAGGAQASKNGPKRTVVVAPGALEASGVNPVPAGNGNQQKGSDKRGRTVVVPPGQDAPAAVGTPSARQPGLAGMVSTSGPSPLAGFLVSFTRDPNGVFWPLRYGRTSIGCGADSDIVLDYPEVSGVHALLNIRDNKGSAKIWITDNNSMNGTAVNGEDIFNEKPDLSGGDVIRVGSVEMKLVLL